MIIDLSYQGLISISGPDAEKFLQGQFTCDIREINPQQSRLGAYCNHKGRVIATFRLFYYQDQYYLILPQEMLGITLTQLKKYGAFSKITLKEVSADFIHLGCFVAKITALNAIQQYLPEKIDAVMPHADWCWLRIPGQQPRYELFAKKSTAEPILNQLYQQLKIAEKEVWQSQDIQAGIPSIYPETSEMFTPHMINYPLLKGVNFNKGCYIGQEVIARTQHLGKAKRAMYYAHIENKSNPLQAGAKLFNPTKIEVGNIVNWTMTTEGYEILAVLAEESIQNSIYTEHNQLLRLPGTH